MAFNRERQLVSTAFYLFCVTIAIEEEINSIIKIFDANEKKLTKMIVTYQDKKGKELESQDVDERKEVIYILK